jgi:hypothetical protein
MAKKPIRTDFFNTYPDADGTTLSDVASNSGHCGLCHYDFNGGGTRNPYGSAVEAERASNGSDSVAAFLAIESSDSDGDGYSNIAEITNSTLDPLSPTFPGLSAANTNNASNVTLSEIADFLTPSSGVDIDPPVVTVISPSSGNIATGNAPFLIEWTADDGAGSGILNIELYLSLDGGSFKLLTKETLGSASTNYVWFVSNRPSTNAVVRVEAYDVAGNEGYADSDAFEIVSPNAFPTTLRDFDQPGTQPIEESGLPQALPAGCASCHGGYSEEHEPYGNWLGSMMAHASFDPIFLANMTIAQQDAPDSADLCLRCHNSRGWLDGRSTPTDGSQMTAEDQFGVSCDLCHRMVDPVYVSGVSPLIDETILDDLSMIPTEPTGGNGMYVFDPNSQRRGPFDDSVSPHTDLYSPFHQESAICGTCHNVSNPVFVRNGTNDEYVANDWDAPATNFSPEVLMPVERTYSEWLYSAYNTSNGVYAPQFAGNKNGGMVASCQDCHMPDILGYGADTNQYPNVPERANLPLHDMTGGSSWLTRLMPGLPDFPYPPGTPEATAISNGAHRAEYMLRKAARMQAELVGDQLKVLVINDTGHKLPTGYPEGRRIWINVQFFDSTNNLIQELGAYDQSTAVLTTTNTTVYEVHPGIGADLALELGMDAGPSLHFVLNNQVYEDNRIPPRGFVNSEFDAFGGAPVGHHYEDGQYWDETFYDLPEGAVRASVRLYYQSTSKEFIEFLRDENTTDSRGQELYDLWAANEKCPPVLMTEAIWPENFSINSIGWNIDEELGLVFHSISGYTYWIEYTDDLVASNVLWKPFLSNGMIEATGTNSGFTDDFTPTTSGEAPTNGHRFYRILR